jgi:pimeloyl-ACP methyl ester carboxylesterase
VPTQVHVRARLDGVSAGTFGYWSVRPGGQAIVFVHGFGGSPADTWSRFPELLPPRAECAGCDLVFYAYDSIYRQAPINGALLHGFLKQLAEDPSGVINPTVPRSMTRKPEFRFTKILIVAHSLGAVVARRALLDAHINKEPWVRSARLLLFAPAHMGATNVRKLAAEGTGLIPVVGPIIRFITGWKVRALEDLEPGSPTLKNLLEHTKDALDKGSAPHLIAERVLFGTGEDIVQTARFCNDPNPTVIHDRGHIDICKPDDAYAEPLTHVVEAL